LRSRFRSTHESAKAELRAAAEADIKAFLEGGGKVRHEPSVVPTLVICPSCGTQSIVGKAKGRQMRCPECRYVFAPSFTHFSGLCANCGTFDPTTRSHTCRGQLDKDVPENERQISRPSPRSRRCSCGANTHTRICRR